MLYMMIWEIRKNNKTKILNKNKNNHINMFKNVIK